MSISTVSLPRFAATCFLATGAPFGIFIGLLYGKPMLGVIVGVVFGALMTATTGWLHFRMARCGSGIADVHQSEQFVVTRTLDAAVAAAEDGLREMGVAWSNMDGGKETVVLEGRTRMTWKSWGEIVRVELGPLVGDAMPVHVTSRPSLRTTIADYGRNLANVRAIRAAMEA